jgi:hypothetical protein
MQTNRVPDATGRIHFAKSVLFRDCYVVVDPHTMSISTYKPNKAEMGDYATPMCDCWPIMPTRSRQQYMRPSTCRSCASRNNWRNRGNRTFSRPSFKGRPSTRPVRRHMIMQSQRLLTLGVK